MKTVLFCITAPLLPLSSESLLSYSYKQPAQPQPSGNTQVSPGLAGSDQEYCQLGSDHTMCQYQVHI